MPNIDILPGAQDTARNFPSGVTLALASGPPAPLGNGDPATWLSAPFAETLYTVIVIDAPLAAIRNLSSGVAANDIPTPSATPPVGNGDPGTDVRTPVAGLIEKALTLLLPLLAAYRKSLITAVVIRLGAKNPPPAPFPPVGKGEPGTTLRAPFAAAENAETLFGLRSLSVYTNVPCAIKHAVHRTIRRDRYIDFFMECSFQLELKSVRPLTNAWRSGNSAGVYIKACFR